MANKHIEVASGNASGANLGELSNPYHFPSDLATAEAAAGSGNILYFLDGTYNNPGDLDQSGLTYESLNLHGAEITGSQLNIGSGSSSVNFKKFKVTPNSTERIELTGATTVVDQIFLTTVESFCVIINTEGAKLNNSLLVNTMAGQVSLFRYANRFGEFSGNTIFLKSLNGRSSGAVTFREGDIDNAKNCIFASDDTANDVFASTFASDSTNCCIFQMGSGNTSGGTNNVFADPLFVDATSDYRLRPSSPCINAGTTS